MTRPDDPWRGGYPCLWPHCDATFVVASLAYDHMTKCPHRKDDQ